MRFSVLLQLIPQSTDILYLLNTFTYGSIVPSMKFIHPVCFLSSYLKSHRIFLHIEFESFSTAGAVNELIEFEVPETERITVKDNDRFGW